MTPSPLELRVLTGPQAGARIALAAGGRVDVGSLDAAGCQVVLRDPRVAQQRVRLHVRPFDVRLEVLSGEVEFNGTWLVAPASADWPLYAPVRLGDTVLAVGAEDGVRWDDALALALSPQPPAPPAEAPAPAARGTCRRAPSAPPARDLAGAGRWRAGAGGHRPAGVRQPRHAAEGGRPRRRRSAWSACWPSPSSAACASRPPARAARRLRVTGDVLTLADRQRLDVQLAGADLSPVVEVRVAEQLAAAVREVFRMNGVWPRPPRPRRSPTWAWCGCPRAWSTCRSSPARRPARGATCPACAAWPSRTNAPPCHPTTPRWPTTPASGSPPSCPAIRPTS